MNSQIRISESSDSEQHNESDRGSHEGDTQTMETKKKNTRRGSDRYHSSSVVPESIQIFFFGYKEFVLNSLTFVENPHTVLDLPASTHRKVLDCWSTAAFRCFILLMLAKRSESLESVKAIVSSFLLLSFLHCHCELFL